MMFDRIANWVLGAPGRTVLIILWTILITYIVLRGLSLPLFAAIVVLIIISIPIGIVWVLSAGGM